MEQHGEDRFWQELVNQLNPGWHVHLGADPTRVPLAAQDTFVYLFDTSTMWLAAAATQSADFGRCDQRERHGVHFPHGNGFIQSSFNCG